MLRVKRVESCHGKCRGEKKTIHQKEKLWKKIVLVRLKGEVRCCLPSELCLVIVKRKQCVEKRRAFQSSKSHVFEKKCLRHDYNMMWQDDMRGASLCAKGLGLLHNSWACGRKRAGRLVAGDDLHPSNSFHLLVASSPILEQNRQLWLPYRLFSRRTS